MQESSTTATIEPPARIQRAMLRRRTDSKMWFDLEIWSNPGGQMQRAKAVRVRIDTSRLGPDIEMKLHVAQ